MRIRGFYPICDRCNDCHNKHTRLSILTFMLNTRRGFVYCVPCWNYIHLKTWTDSEGHKHTLRSEKEVTI